MASYWLAEDSTAVERRPLGRTPDLEIVGGGVTGVSCALAAARAGLAVRLHDARGIAEGASGRNGGFALRGGAIAYDQGREYMGAEALDYWRLTEGALDRMVELVPDAFRRNGSLRLALDAEERDEIRAEYEALRADGLDAEWREELEGPLAGRFAAAILHPDDAALHPARFVRSLARLAVEAGVEIVEHHRVGSLDELEAERVVVATDGYPSGLLGPLEGAIIPTRGQMIATEPIEERLFELPHYGRHGFDYWHQTPDGRILAGGFRDAALDSEFTDEELTTPLIQAALESFVAELVGRPLRVEQRWAGIFGLVLDFLPVVGPLPGSDRVWIAGGYSGHGNVLGFLCGELVATAIAGEPHPLLARFDPARLL